MGSSELEQNATDTVARRADGALFKAQLTGQLEHPVVVIKHGGHQALCALAAKGGDYFLHQHQAQSAAFEVRADDHAKLGLDVVCVQAKRWQGTVSRPTIQSFVGSMDMIRAKKGVVITTSDYSRDAIDFVDRIEGKRVVLINGKQLAQLMIEHDVGVSTIATYSLKEVSNDFFEEDLG